MSAPNFTPGPWHPGHLGGDGACQCTSVVNEGYAGGICRVVVGNNLPIGEGGNDGPPRSEAIGNMHLIAAAPDLYAFAEEVRRRCIEMGMPGHELCTLAEAVLSKASPSNLNTGEATP